MGAVQREEEGEEEDERPGEEVHRNINTDL